MRKHNPVKNLGIYARGGKAPPPWNKGINSLPLCIDCNIRLKDYRSKRCGSCAGRKRMIGKKLTEETKAKIAKKSIFQKGNKYGNRFNLGYKPWNLGMPAWNRGLPAPWTAGENHHSWKGGITPFNKLIRHSLKYRMWRNVVFERDSYTCQVCGIRGGKIHAHHRLPFSLYPELRLDIVNGQTLCEKCHKEKTREYWEIYIGEYKPQIFVLGWLALIGR